MLILDEDTENTLCKPIQILLNWTDTPQISVNAQMLEKYTKSTPEEHTDTHSDAVVNNDGEVVLVSDDEGEPAHKKHKLDDDHFEVLSD